MTQDQLIASAETLLDLDARGALVPHGIGGHARTIIEGFLALSRRVPASGELDPEALTAAYEARRAHAADPGRKGSGLEKAIRAYLASLPLPVAETPEGWRLVPVEPTDEMCEAFVTEMRKQGVAFDDFSEPIYPAKMYAAMVAAAPAAPEGKAEPGEPRETAWLIERPGRGQHTGPRWWRSLVRGRPATIHVVDATNDNEWTTDPNEAIRFARQIDAEDFIKALDLPPMTMKATEHIWIGGRSWNIYTYYREQEAFWRDRAQAAEKELASLAPPAPEGKAEPVALRDIASERERQKDVEGWTPQHDDRHTGGEMALAAAAYAYASQYPAELRSVGGRPNWWPWNDFWWKPTTPRRDLVKAGALIVAEIERLDRAQTAANVPSHPAPDRRGSIGKSRWPSNNGGQP